MKEITIKMGSSTAAVVEGIDAGTDVLLRTPAFARAPFPEIKLLPAHEQGWCSEEHVATALKALWPFARFTSSLKLTLPQFVPSNMGSQLAEVGEQTVRALHEAFGARLAELELQLWDGAAEAHTEAGVGFW